MQTASSSGRAASTTPWVSTSCHRVCKGCRRRAPPLKPVASVSSQQAPASKQTTADALQQPAEVVQLYRYPGLSKSAAATLLRKVQQTVSLDIEAVEAELCFNVAFSSPLTAEEASTLTWLLTETFEPELTTPTTRFGQTSGATAVVEVGPRMSFSTAWSANAVSICHSCGLSNITRIEKSYRYQLQSGKAVSQQQQLAFAAMVHDRMTEQVYPTPLLSFKTDMVPTPVFTVPIMSQGAAALEQINEELGLAFDEWDLKYYTALFQDDLKRDPTNVELFDMAQSNSEHSRHWFFGANIVIDGQPQPDSLMKIMKSTLSANLGNSVIGFKDNSSAIRGFETRPILPLTEAGPAALAPQDRDWDILLTAETHNFPCAVAPYPGAETGAGGRIRDTHATGTGSIMGASTAGYCVGNLLLDKFTQSWEDPSAVYPGNLASPLQILIDASNGASDYGNKFGEPLIAGYTRTFGMRIPDGTRREWIKPIMFSGGIGQIDHRHLEKNPPEVGMLVIKIGGPAYRIGMGGGAASSVPSGGSSRAELDFNAVQRGDAEMSNKLWRVVRACVELGAENPIQQIHDQGAGGNCNVVKEIIYPLGAEIDIRAIKLGDETMSVLEIWGAEYQENDALLIKPEARGLLEEVCRRERCNMQVIGTIDGSGKIVLKDKNQALEDPVPVDLDLEKVLGDMPRKTYNFTRSQPQLQPHQLPQGTSAMDALQKVLRLPAVHSKRFLTSKVDRCVTGLVAQQQCVGPLQLPISNVAVMAQSHFGLTGAATAIGEQPLKGLINPAAMARLCLGEALTNLVWAQSTGLADIKASVNWMYAAKMASEGVAMYEAATALKEAMVELQVACDGGKDSLSMAASAGGETVMAPGNLVISAYVTCPDITKTLTPDLKLPGSGKLIHVDLAQGQNRHLGGSCLGQVYSQLGNDTPDVDVSRLKAMYNTTQSLIADDKISAGHDISDGGIAVTLLEAAFAGNCGIQVNLACSSQSDEFGGMAELRDVWEEGAFHLERLQAAEECVNAEQALQASRQAPTWTLPFTPTWTPEANLKASGKVRVAVMREEGSNGDREMAAAVYSGGMEPWDVTMSDLLNGRASLDSYADVMDSAKGWAGTIRCNRRLSDAFKAFYNRPDTFSLGVCNGCQLMALLGWVPGTEAQLPDPAQPRFIHNTSGRFESRWATVQIQEDSPAIMLKGMGGSSMGIWCAHGEGRAHFPDPQVKQAVLEGGLAPIRYQGPSQEVTEQYPFNPNGSPEGIAALCSPNGRHLAIMPHPERCFLMWQNPWFPGESGLTKDGPGPWLKLFQNAREWCESL
ncbi:MAG: putative phosphoribosylformylglycinamidine chloroplastic mitochondrial-like [Trebouxia sp. A1-2]|nr:MAG: putative phosphoribosylformylglycinamidine chloroplastic mitochondrial-like [Trebouxia sp. A1-2]